MSKKSTITLLIFVFVSFFSRSLAQVVDEKTLRVTTAFIRADPSPEEIENRIDPELKEVDLDMMIEEDSHIRLKLRLTAEDLLILEHNIYTRDFGDSGDVVKITRYYTQTPLPKAIPNPNRSEAGSTLNVLYTLMRGQGMDVDEDSSNAYILDNPLALKIIYETDGKIYAGLVLIPAELLHNVGYWFMNTGIGVADRLEDFQFKLKLQPQDDRA